ncbi:hypothetical protein N3K66_008321 [Trichothecium roseum]|uniref:Uncharacterized protein n=1 Tax=Trichothecium roseum TaxID=47278 RepID=A0ACC0UUV9_9HYPO|nr:hypothetical protein N3K66_008321 [Trichothecium roseum]
MDAPGFTIRPAQHADVAAVAQLCEDAFEMDRQTQMKALGDGHHFSMREHMLESLPSALENPRCVVLKAVDDATGEIAGFCNWGFRGFAAGEVPAPEGSPRKVVDEVPPPLSSEKRDGDDDDGDNAGSPAKEGTGEKEDDPIKRLEAFTSADMKRWMRDTMPEGTRCLYVIGLSVSPAHKGRGVASALLRFGTGFCDGRRAFAWAHSSEPAWRLYERCGFRVARRLDVDLDEYAPASWPAPPGEEKGSGAGWGRYVFRYMKYVPDGVTG